MPLLSDPPPMGSGGSPNQASIIFNIEEIIKRGVNANHLADLFDNIKTIEGQWTFSTNPKFGTSTGFLKTTSGVLSFETLADVATSNDYNDLDNLPSLATVATSGAYSDLSGTPTIPTTLTDLGSPTADFSMNGYTFTSLKKIWVEDTDKITVEDIDKGFLDIRGLGTSADHFTPISFSSSHYSTNALAKIAMKSTDSGSELHLVVSNNYTLGANLTIAKFDVLGLTLKGGLFFDTNNIYDVGSSSIAPSDIYAVNALNVTSDKRDKIINEKLNLKKDFSFDFLEKMVKNCIISWKWNPTILPEKKINSFEKITRKNEKTNIDEIDYILTTKILEPEKIVEHKRSHIGLNLNELFKLMTEFKMSTKDYAFLSINNTYEEKSYDEKGNEVIEIKNSFDEFGDPILDPDGYPLGKMTYKPQELQSLLFIYSLELHKRDIENKKKIDDLETRLSDIEKQMKILLKK